MERIDLCKIIDCTGVDSECPGVSSCTILKRIIRVVIKKKKEIVPMLFNKEAV